MAGAEFDDMARSTRWRCSLTWLPNCRWTATRELTWGERDLVDAALATLARDAVGLLIGPRTSRIKECEHPEGSLLFVDDSQAGRRCWCSMDAVGPGVCVDLG
jgi:predicted RNA-binding Zn ribbon-like protein